MSLRTSALAQHGAAGFHSASGNVTLKVDLALAGYDLSRFGGAKYPFGGLPRFTSGSYVIASADPTFTRWLPLAFSPTASSQPFRTALGALPAPWGNVHCAYSMSLVSELIPNPDLSGIGLFFYPRGSSGDYNSPAPPYISAGNRAVLVPSYVLTDADEDRLAYNSTLLPLTDVHSTLSVRGDGKYVLSNAGPPGSLKYKGRYTYILDKLAGTLAFHFG